MDWYLVFKLLHVFAVIAWVGGGLGVLFGGEMLRLKRGPKEVATLIDLIALMSPVFFIPVSLSALVFGILTAWTGPGFTELWVILGLVGFAATFLNGILMIKPRSDRISAMMANGDTGSDQLMAAASTLLVIGRFDYVMLGLVVADMVLKPVADDVMVLGIMAALLVVGTVFTLGTGLRRA